MPATFVVASDTFTRANQSGFGTASDGEVWSEPIGTGVLSIVSNRGQIATNTGSTVVLLGTGTQGNVDLLVRFSLSAASSDLAGVVVRYLDSSDYVRVEVQNGLLQVRKVVGGVATILSPVTSVAISNSANYWIHLSAYDSSYLVNVWPDGTSEPAGWMLNCIDVQTQISGAGQYGLYALLASGLDTALFDSFQALTIPQAVLKVGGVQVPFEEDTLKIAYKLDERMRMQVTAIDYNGPAVFSPFLFGEQVIFTDPTLGKLFQGFLLTSTQDKTKMYPSPAIEYQLDTVDNRHLLDKRRSQKLYTNTSANLILADLIQRYVSGEGVTGNFALLWAEQQSEWSQGTNTSTTTTTNAATVNAGAGDLELATNGSSAGFTLSSHADFAGLVTTGLSAPSSGGVTFAPTPAIKLQATEAMPGITNAYIYVKIWDRSLGAYTIPNTFPTLFYDIWIADSCPKQMAGIELVCTDGTSFMASAANFNVDPQGVNGALNNDLSGLATNQWYSRTLPLYGVGSMGGKSLQYVAFAFGGSNQGIYTAYVRNVRIAQSDGVTNLLSVFSTSATAIAITPQQVQTNGYNAMSCTFVTSYERHGAMQSAGYTFPSTPLVQASNVTWTITLPNSNFTFELTASIDSFSTFLPCTINSPLPGLLPGMNMSGRTVTLVWVFDNAGNDPTLTPNLSALSVSLSPSYSATKSDLTNTTNATSGWLAGTLTNLVQTSTKTLNLNGVTRNYDDGNSSSQTLYTAGTASQFLLRKQFAISANSGTEARSRLDFAGSTWQNFTAELDIVLVAASVQLGLVYRTTGWQNNNDTYGYTVVLSDTLLQLGRGTNSASGAGTFTLITSIPITLTVNQTYHLKVVVNGNSHQVYVNDVFYISATDSTYPAAGYVGFRVLNNNASSQTALFDNFGVVATLSGQWVSPAIDIHSLGTVSTSQILIQIEPLVNTTLVSQLVEISLNNGSTWATCPNTVATPVILGQGYFQSLPVPGLSAGTNVSGMTQVLIRLTITATSASLGSISASPNIAADIQAVSLFLVGGYTSTGSRTSAPLVWDSMQRIAVASGWGNTSAVQAYSQVGTGTTATTGSEATIANTTGDVHMVPTSATQGDTDGTVRFSLSAATITAGMELRYSDANDFYRFAASTTTLSLIKMSGGVSTTLATASMALATGSFYQMRFRIVGSGMSAPVNLYGRVWADHSSEPTTWSVTASD